MPELPDVTVYIECLERRVLHRPLRAIRLLSPFVLRTVDPPPSAAHGREVIGLTRLGKRIVFALAGDLYLVFHLMIAGRLRWRDPGAKIHGKLGLLAVDFDNGTLMMTEAARKKRASLHVVLGAQNLAAHDPGGLEPMHCDLDGFIAALTRENRTLKRALTDPRILAGVGNAYSDEILHRAGLSPVKRTAQLDRESFARLHDALRAVLDQWTDHHRRAVGDGFPDKVTAFHEAMAVHGRFGKPCPRCGDPVQRIVFADNESNYCATCQTGGKLLADRALSPLFRGEWPKTLEEMEELKDRA